MEKPQEQIASAASKKTQYFDPFTLMSDQDRISPHNINQISDENKEKYQFGN